MNKVLRFVAVWTITLSLVLTSCAFTRDGGSTDPGAEKTCVEGVCAEITVSQPIVLNQQTDVIVTISSTIDKPGLSIKLQASPTNVTFGSESLWEYDAVANQSRIFNSTVTFTSPGEYLIAAGVFWNGSPLLVNQDRVVVDSDGAVVNPTINPNPTSDVFLPSTPSPESMTTTAIPSTPSTSPSDRTTPTQLITGSTFPQITPLALPKGILSEGTILFDPPGKGPLDSIVIEMFQRDMASPEPFLSQQRCCVFLMITGNQMMSPDHRYAAIVRDGNESSTEGRYLIVTDGKMKITADMEKLQARDIAYWPNNTEVFLYPTDDSYPGGRLLLFNPFTQQMKVMSPNFPNLIDGRLYHVPNWGRAVDTPKYDPSLSRVVYYENNLEQLDWAISLWDIQTGTELWRRNLKTMTARPWSSEPEWSPDGSRIAILLPDAIHHETLELTLVDRDGKETVLHDPAISQKITWGGKITWSPNGQYLSVYIEEEYIGRLLIYDFDRGQVWDPAITVRVEDEGSGFAGGMIWSPDSRQLLVNNIFPKDNYFAYVVDVEKKQIYNFGFRFGTAVWITSSEQE